MSVDAPNAMVITPDRCPGHVEDRPTLAERLLPNMVDANHVLARNLWLHLIERLCDRSSILGRCSIVLLNNSLTETVSMPWGNFTANADHVVIIRRCLPCLGYSPTFAALDEAMSKLALSFIVDDVIPVVDRILIEGEPSEEPNRLIGIKEQLEALDPSVDDVEITITFSPWAVVDIDANNPFGLELIFGLGINLTPVS